MRVVRASDGSAMEAAVGENGATVRLVRVDANGSCRFWKSSGLGRRGTTGWRRGRGEEKDDERDLDLLWRYEERGGRGVNAVASDAAVSVEERTESDGLGFARENNSLGNDRSQVIWRQREKVKRNVHVRRKADMVHIIQRTRKAV
jgi:hypothetical protein